MGGGWACPSRPTRPNMSYITLKAQATEK